MLIIDLATPPSAAGRRELGSPHACWVNAERRALARATGHFLLFCIHRDTPHDTSAAPSTAWASSRSADRRPSSRQPNTSAPRPSRPEHRRIPQHIRHDEQPDVRASDVHPIEVGHAPIALRNVDVLELHVHVVFGFKELAAVCLAGIDLNRHLMALRIDWSAVAVR